MSIFTPDEVQSLTLWQSTGEVHPFTCINRDDGNHRDDGHLIPTVRGWICQYCGYTQDWAHDGMKRFAK